jgi:hypothetical protein
VSNVLRDDASDKITVSVNTDGDVWVRFYEGSGHIAMMFDSESGANLRKFRRALKAARRTQREAKAARG